MRVKKIIPIGLLFLILLWWKPLDASACSCVMPPPPEDALDEANVVFSGEVVEIIENKKLFGGSYGKTVHFKVDKAWKGTVESEMVITTGNDDGDCGFSFEKGQNYLVYASISNMYVEGTLSTTICHRTTKISNATEDLNALGEGQEVSSLQEGLVEDETAFPWWIFTIFMFGLVILLIGFRYKKSHKNARS